MSFRCPKCGNTDVGPVTNCENCAKDGRIKDLEIERDALAKRELENESLYLMERDKVDSLETRIGLLQTGDDLDELRKECDEQARLNGMGSSREAKLMTERDEARKALGQAEAKIAEIGIYMMAYEELRGKLNAAEADLAASQARVKELEAENQRLEIISNEHFSACECQACKEEIAASQAALKEESDRANGFVYSLREKDAQIIALEAQSKRMRETLEAVFRWTKSVKRLEEAEGLDAILLLLQKTMEVQHGNQ